MLSSDNYTHGGSQGYNRYTYAMNNPLKYTDPSGQVFVIAPAVIGLVGGALNLWSNWSNVTGTGTAVMYFGAGAVGALAPNPYLGSAITTLANRAIALATGKLPQNESIGDFLTNTGLEVGKGMAAVFGAKLIAPLIAPHLQKLGNLIKDKASYFVSTSVVGDIGFKKLGESITDGLEATADFVVTATRRGSPAYLQLANGGRLGARKAFAMMMNEGDDVVSTGASGKVIEDANHRFHHIFDKTEHALDNFVEQMGSREKAFEAVSDAANKAFQAGELTPNINGILPKGDLGHIIDVGGTQIRLIGGRIMNNRVIIASFSRKGL